MEIHPNNVYMFIPYLVTDHDTHEYKDFFMCASWRKDEKEGDPHGADDRVIIENVGEVDLDREEEEEEEEDDHDGDGDDEMEEA